MGRNVMQDRSWGEEASAYGESLFSGFAGSNDRCGQGRRDVAPCGSAAIWRRRSLYGEVAAEV